jgi:hypothetical protein
MTVLRPILACTLCVALLLGNAPAWLHVASCCRDHGVGVRPDSHSCAVDDQDASSGEACAEACSHQCGDAVAAESQAGVAASSGVTEACGSTGHQCSDSGDSTSDPRNQHDSGRCVVCQSLVCPGGALVQFSLPLAIDLLCESALTCEQPIPLPAVLGISLPRGPPVV